MKKLLFIGLMSVAFVLAAGEDQGQKQVQEQEKKIYLMDFCEKRVLPEVPTVDCKKINALSDEQFDILLDRLFTRGMLIIHVLGCSDQYKKYQDRFTKEHALAMRINKCRSIAPFVCKQSHAVYIRGFENPLEYSKNLMQLSETEFEKWEKEASKINKKIKWDAFWFEGYCGEVFKGVREIYEVILKGNKGWDYEPQSALVRFMVSPSFIKEVHKLREEIKKQT